MKDFNNMSPQKRAAMIGIAYRAGYYDAKEKINPQTKYDSNHALGTAYEAGYVEGIEGIKNECARYQHYIDRKKLEQGRWKS